MDLRWKHPFTTLVAGLSGSGKSRFVVRSIRHARKTCDTNFHHIHWHHHPGLRPVDIDLPAMVTFKTGLPNMQDYDGVEPVLVVVDDMMHESDSNVADLFTKGSHYRKLSVFFITQNLFHQGRGQRDISLNAHYIALFKNPRDKALIKHLAGQVYLENTRFVEEAYADATRADPGYLLLDLKQSTPDELRVRTCMFPDDGPCGDGGAQYVYQPVAGPATDEDRARVGCALLEEVVESLPKTYKQDVRYLMRLMGRRCDAVSWDEDGTVHVGGVRVASSNIVDVMHHNVRVRAPRPETPLGWREVMTRCAT